MKKQIKYLAVLLACIMLTAVIPTAFAQNHEAAPGKSATVTFNVSGVIGNIMSINNLGGSILSIDDPNGIISSYTQQEPKTGLTGQYGNDSIYYYGSDAASFSQSYVFKISSTAVEGQSATVTFCNYEVTDADGNLVDGVAISHTITVKSASSGGNGGGGSGSTEPEVKVDYTDLKKQIGIAEGMDSVGYTSQSWSDLKAALKSGNSALKSKVQADVDAAAAALADAISKLVKMDYSQLESALTDAEDFTSSDDLAEIWAQLTDAVARGEELMTSGDQAEVDAVAAEIAEILSTIREELEELRTPIIQEVEVEVPVEVLPEDDFCNIPIHQIWPILFCVSLALNAALAAVLVMTLTKKKHKRKDSVPLVTYDIEDDI